MKRQLQRSDSSDYSNSDCFEIRKHEDDDISVSEMMLRKRKKLKTATTLLEPSSSSGAWKRNWTKTEELLILEGIEDYEKENKCSYTSDWNAIYDRIRDSMGSDFSKKQLVDKVYKLKLRFGENQARSNAGKRLSFTSAHDKQVFKLSTVIWGNNKTKYEIMDQTKERVSNAIDDGEKDKCEDLNVLQDALEVAAAFPSLGIYQQKSLLRNLKNLGATQRKKLTDEWKALLGEDMQLGIKKQSFYAKLVKEGFSA
ncbi:GLABROUS1 enhancer-binding protein family [Arabidopsis thaliana x Arabidopsis arenosa]|uniref:GLABROUS1 enhancer-binding protein family n=1 Tax=Arabidopsis thaliana x Arabidopsis arenosa TaxID=1240361 RepID=A0A8T1YDZ3_9BRAS|nr:GLABROUS1 enhancer-binding protein family [Arabidopsis thaliana x Arabidopsis arenosa]